MVGLRTYGADDLDRVAAALKAAGDKELQKAVSAAFRKEGKPLGERVLIRGSQEMPKRGGFADRVRARGRVGVSASLRGKVASVAVILRNKYADLRSLDAGTLRHPVFGRKQWIAQAVPDRAFTRAFDEQKDAVEKASIEAAQGVLDDVARKA